MKSTFLSVIRLLTVVTALLLCGRAIAQDETIISDTTSSSGLTINTGWQIASSIPYFQSPIHNLEMAALANAIGVTKLTGTLQGKLIGLRDAGTVGHNVTVADNTIGISVSWDFVVGDNGNIWIHYKVEGAVWISTDNYIDTKYRKGYVDGTEKPPESQKKGSTRSSSTSGGQTTTTITTTFVLPYSFGTWDGYTYTLFEGQQTISFTQMMISQAVLKNKQH